MNFLDETGWTARASLDASLHEYPNFLVRSVSGRAIGTTASVKLHYRTIEVSYNFITAQMEMIKKMVSCIG